MSCLSKEKPVVSMIIPTHKRVALLREALDSVYAQAGVGDEFAMEVIVVEDAFSEATSEVVGRYPGARYIINNVTRGASAARNEGIRASTGKYVAFLDDDDLCLPNRLRVLTSVLEANPEVGVVYGQMIVQGDGEETPWPDADRAPSGSAFEGILMEEFMHPSQVMIRRQAFEKAGYFNEALLTMEHYDLFLRLAFHVPFAFIAVPIAVGRFSEQGKWFTNIKGGGYEQNVPIILERALGLVSDPNERAKLRKKAYVSWLSEITHWLERTGNIDRMRNHVLASVKRDPWMLTEPWVRDAIARNLCKVACALAIASDSPIAAVRELSAQVMSPVKPHGMREWFNARRVFAQMWAAVGYVLAKAGGSRHRRAAGSAAWQAVIHNPAQIRRKVVLQLLRYNVVA